MSVVANKRPKHGELIYQPGDEIASQWVSYVGEQADPTVHVRKRGERWTKWHAHESRFIARYQWHSDAGLTGGWKPRVTATQGTTIPSTPET